MLGGGQLLIFGVPRIVFPLIPAVVAVALIKHLGQSAVDGRIQDVFCFDFHAIGLFVVGVFHFFFEVCSSSSKSISTPLLPSPRETKRQLRGWVALL